MPLPARSRRVPCKCVGTWGLWLLVGVVMIVPACTNGSGGGGLPVKTSAPSGTSAPPSITGHRPSDDVRILHLDTEAGTIDVEFVRYFTNEQANRAAREDGVIGPGEQLPNPVYVRDLHRTGTLSLAADVRVRLRKIGRSGNAEPVWVSLSKFTKVFNAGFPIHRWYPGDIYRLIRHNGLVTEIRQLQLV